jgi:hypothetical protein
MTDLDRKKKVKIIAGLITTGVILFLTQGFYLMGKWNPLNSRVNENDGWLSLWLNGLLHTIAGGVGITILLIIIVTIIALYLEIENKLNNNDEV